MELVSGQRYRIVSVHRGSMLHRYASLLIGQEVIFHSQDAGGDIAFTPVNHKVTECIAEQGILGPDNWYTVILGPLEEKPFTLSSKPISPVEDAWDSYCDQMECTASGRCFEEHAGDLEHAFRVGFQYGQLSGKPQPASKQLVDKPPGVFAVGDRVYVARGTQPSNLHIGMEGRVLKVNNPEWIAVRMDANFRGHECGGLCESGHGWNFAPHEIAHVTIPF